MPSHYPPNDYYYYNNNNNNNNSPTNTISTSKIMDRRRSSQHRRESSARPGEKQLVYKQEKHYIFNQKPRPLSNREIHERQLHEQQHQHHRQQQPQQQQQQRDYPDKIHVPYNNHHDDSISHLEQDARTNSFHSTTSPSFPYFDPENVKDDGTTIEWCIDLPGVEPDTLKAVFHESTFTLSGYRHSGGMKAFGSEFDVDVTKIDSDSISANLRHGVLLIKANKRKHGPPRDIPITSYSNDEEEAEGKKKLAEVTKRKDAAQRKLEGMRQRKLALEKKEQHLRKKLAHALPQPDDYVSLLVEIVSAKDLLKADRFGLSDPYVRIALDGDDVYQTKYVRQTLNPKFTEAHKNKFVWNGRAKSLSQANGFTFLLMDRDTFSADDPLGDFSVTMEDLVTMNGKAHEYIVTPPAHLRTETELAGTCKIRVSLATSHDRKKYNAISSTKCFWEPPESEVLELYRKEKLFMKNGNSSHRDLDASSSSIRSMANSSRNSIKVPSQRKVVVSKNNNNNTRKKSSTDESNGFI